MNTQTISTRLPPESGELDLDARILRAEHRLIAREERLRQGIDALGQRVRQSVRPWRHALPAVAAALGMSALVALGLRWQRRGALWHKAAKATPSPDAAATAYDGGIPWVRLLALGWPMLPAAWRSKLSPATASTLVALGLPTIEWLLRGRRPAPPATHPAVDLARFGGTWHVVAQLPRRFGQRRAGRATLHYLPRPDGHIDVLWSWTEGAQIEATQGLAQVVPGSGGARLKLSQWPAWLRRLPQAWNEHWILHVDERYTEALVGSPARDQLFVLSRQPSLAPQRHAELRQRAHERGFAVERLEFPVEAPA